MSPELGQVRDRLLALGFIVLILVLGSGCSGLSSSAKNTNNTAPIQFSGTTLATAAVGTAYSATLNITGGTAPYSFSTVTGTLPSGLSLSSATGVISGTPTASGQFSFTVRVSDSSTPLQTAQTALSISVNPRNGVVISTTAPPSGTVGTAYSTTLTASGGTTPYSWTLASGTLPVGLSLSKGGTISGTPTAVGVYNFTVQVTDSSSPVQTAIMPLSISTSAAGVLLSITSSSVPNGTVGAPYSSTLTASGGVTPYSWTVTVGALPAGLSLSNGGTISGTPKVAGQSNFTVQVSDSSSPTRRVSKAFTPSVVSKLAITGTIKPNTRNGAFYSSTDQASGGAPSYTWSVAAGSLPPGLTLGAITGTISGTPNQDGTYNFTLKVVDSSSPVQSATQADKIAVVTPTNNAWSLQTTAVGWQFVAPDSSVSCKYNAVSKVDISDLHSAGTDAEVLNKYGTWNSWAQQQSDRLTSLGFTAAGQYSYQYMSNYPAGGLPYAPTAGNSGYAMQDIAHAGLGPFHAKDLMYIANKNGMKCGGSYYQGSEIDPYDPATATAFNSLLANNFVTAFSMANAIIVIPDEADFLFGIDNCCSPNNAHPDVGLILASNSPAVLQSRPGSPYYSSGNYWYPDSELYAKQAMRDYLLEEYLCTGVGTPSGGFCTGAGKGTGSADPSSSNYVGAANAANALSALNTAWSTSYTTWNTSDPNGLSGISGNSGSPVNGEAFATANGNTYSFTHTAASLPVHVSTYQVFVNGVEVATDNGSTILAPIGSSGFADGGADMWQADTAYALNAQARAGAGGNCMLIATTAGTSGSSLPSVPSCPGTSPLPKVDDGSVVWTVLGPRPTIEYGTGVGIATFTSPPANGAAIKISYSGGGSPYQSWGGNSACSASGSPYACCTGSGTGSCTQGSGLLDENGTNLVKAGQSCGGLTGNGIQENESWSNPAQIQTDIDAFAAALAGTYAQTLQSAWLAACGTTCPPLVIPAYNGPSNGTSSVYAAMAPYADAFWVAQGQYNSIPAVAAKVQEIVNNDGGKPVIVANYYHADPDSWNNDACPSGSGVDCQTTQALRGSQIASLAQSVLPLKNPNGKFAVVGLEHWALYDSNTGGDKNNYGLFTPNDNGYDGSAASTVTSRGSCASNTKYTQPWICQDSNGNYEGLAVSSCTSGGATPTWNTNFNGYTNDGSCVWFNEGPYTPNPESANWGNALGPITNAFTAGICDP
jgi:Putative Ig domain